MPSSNTFFKIKSTKLKKIINLANQISLKKDQNPKFTSTRLQLENREVLLSATDGLTHFKTFLKIEDLQENSEKGSENSSVLYVHTQSLNSILNLTEDDYISIFLNDNRLIIKDDRSTKQLNLNLVKDDYIFPQPRQEDNYDLFIKFKINIQDFIKACKSAFISVGTPKNSYQPEFLNIVFDFKIEDKQLAIVSSDKFRLTKNLLKIDILEVNQENIENNNIFHFFPKPLQFVNNVLSDNLDADLVITVYRYFTFFEFNNTTISLSYGNDSKFPPYDKIIPQSFASSFEVRTEDFLKACKQVSWCISDNVNKPVSFNLDPIDKSLTFKAENSSGDSSEYKIPIYNYEGDQEVWTLKFNLGYLEDYLNTIDTEMFLWEVNYQAPSVLSPFESKDRQIYLVSGLR